jgi:SNW domain-containing protein 1
MALALHKPQASLQRAGSYHDLVEKDTSEMNLAKPSEDDLKAAAERTRLALTAVVQSTSAKHHPAQQSKDPTFVRYTPGNQSGGIKQRIIRLQEMPVDPLEPPKFKHKKIPNAPPSPPAAVMHSPPRKVTAEDQQNWKIPPCISNWKNIKGHTIPLDKRLAADGRGMEDVQINDKFAKLSEALFVAERVARKEIESRAKVLRTLSQRKKEAKEEELRKLAAQARAAGGRVAEAEDEDQPAADGGDKEADIEARAEREELRRETQRDIKRNMRMEKRVKDKDGKTKPRQERERDVSEKIALGQKVQKTQDALFDQRLFNQTSGMDSGFGADDSYSAFDKPLFSGSSATQIYRPKRGDSDVYGDEATAATGDAVSKLINSRKRAFSGTEETAASAGANKRSKPVEFEKDTADPFGIDKVFDAAKRGGDKEKERGDKDRDSDRGGRDRRGGDDSDDERDRRRRRDRD